MAIKHHVWERVQGRSVVLRAIDCDLVLGGHGDSRKPAYRTSFKRKPKPDRPSAAGQRVPTKAGHAFQCEAGRLFRSKAGRGSDLMSATLRRASAGRWDDVFLCWPGQVDGSSIRRLRMLSPASSIR